MANKHCIFLLEDEEESGELLANFLEMNNYDVIWSKEGHDAIKQIDQHANRIHLAVLDIMVPGKDGKEVCSYIRKHPVLSDIPVIFLTARDEEEQEIEGLELGADDYISKPASLNLIKVRVETHLRRQKGENANWLQFGNVYLDTDSKEMFINDKKVNLTLTEYTIAEMMFKHPKMVFSRQVILENISDDGDKFVFDRTVDVHVKNLRIKMGDAGDMIKTYRGVGYGFNREFINS